jgi:hypothetical protein
MNNLYFIIKYKLLASMYLIYLCQTESEVNISAHTLSCFLKFLQRKKLAKVLIFLYNRLLACT